MRVIASFVVKEQHSISIGRVDNNRNVTMALQVDKTQDIFVENVIRRLELGSI